MLELKKTDKERVVMYGSEHPIQNVEKVYELGVAFNKIIFSGPREDLLIQNKDFWDEFLGHKPLYKMFINIPEITNAWHVDFDLCKRAALKCVEGDFILIVREKI